MRLAVLSLLCLFGACFQEQPADRVWRCSADQPQCPEGQSCINNWCVKDGTAMPDLSLPLDGAWDMIGAPCSDRIAIGSSGVLGCRGKFSPNTTKASALCPSGYRLCTDASKVTDAECSSSSIMGFFFADVSGNWTGPQPPRCAIAGQAGAGNAFFGCGNILGAITPSTTTSTPCKGFSRLTYCNTTTPFYCEATEQLSLDNRRMDDARNGVLCCPP